MNPIVVPVGPLVGAVASIVVGALFAASDTAITSLSSSRLEALIDQAVEADRDVYRRIQQHDAKIRSRYLLGRVASTAVTAICLLEVFQPSFGEVAGWISLAVTVVLTSVVFELTTTLARQHGDVAALWAARWMRPLELLMLPFATPLGWLGVRMARRAGEQSADPRVTEAHVGALVDESERAGVLGGEPAEMIRNVLDFAELTAKDAMIPRDRVEAIDVSASVAEVARFVAESGHSRYPVYKGQIDNVLGLLYAKDLYKAVEGIAGGGAPASTASPVGAPRRIESIIRPANFVPESQPLARLLREMRWRRQHMAIVVDEFGAVSGVVTLEDILEEIVGEIHDEHDTAHTIEDLGDGRVMADAAVSMGEIFAHLGADAPDPSTDATESVGGMLAGALGVIPRAGRTLDRFGLRFTVRMADEKHVCKVEVHRT